MAELNENKVQNSPVFSGFLNKMDQYLFRKNLKQTDQRKLIVKKFLEMEPHVDADDLYFAAVKDDPNIGLATIYRTMNLLKEAGLVHQYTFAYGKAVFEIAEPDEHHDHLICVQCRSIIDFKNEKIEELQNQVALENGFVLTSHRMDLYGSCKDCK